MSAAKTLAGTFVVVFALTVGVVTVGTVVFDDGTQTTDVEHDHINASLIAEQTADGGEIEMESTEQQNTIVIHTGAPERSNGGMGSPFPIEAQSDDRQLSIGSLGGQERDVDPLASVLVENGHEVVYYQGGFEGGPLSATLEDADAFLMAGSTPLSADEREAVTEFADAGGRTVIAADPGSSGDIDQLASSQGLYTDAGYLYNLVENDNNYLSVYTEPTGESELTEGVDRTVFRGVAAVGSSEDATIIETNDQTRHSTTREMGTYDVAAVHDNVAMIGDSSFMTPENAYRADNNVLVGNLADFLVTGPEPTVDFGADAGPGAGGEFGDGGFDNGEFSEETP